MATDAIYIIAIGAIVAGFIQGLSGFAFSMVSMSFWVWVLDPRLAATLAVFGALTGQILSAFSVRKGFNLQLLWPFIAGGLLGIPMGVAVLPHLNMEWFKAIFGALLVVWCSVMLFAKHLPAFTAGGRIADGIVGVAGGVMGGIGGLTGPVPTLWCVIRGYDRDAQRSIIQNFNLSMLMITMITYLATGIVTSDMLPMFALVLPTMLIPTLLGARFYKKINDTTFRKVVLTLLTVSGISLLVSSVPRLLEPLI